MDTPLPERRETEYIELQREKLRQLVLAVRKVARTREGKIIWSHLKSIGYMDKPIFDHDGNLVRAATRDGMRRLVLHLQDLHRYKPDRDQRGLKIITRDNERSTDDDEPAEAGEV